jgi:Protein of unknown function (DUF1152)
MSQFSANQLPPFAWPSWEGERVFVVGIGGGSDIISAFALGEGLQPRPKELSYGNTKTRPERDWVMLSPHLATLPEAPTKNGLLKISSGSTTMDRLLPRGPRGDPFICMLEKGTESRLADEIKGLGFSVILAVDTGGDVLARNGKRGRDQVMLSVLEQLGLPLWLFVLAPGADGQRSKEKLDADLLAASRERSFCGAFSLELIRGVYQKFAPSLPKTKTPNLVLQAFESKEETMLIPRGCHPVLPVEWLRMGMAFALRGA